MMDKPSVDYAAFDRYVRGTASVAEAAAVREWLADPVNTLIAQHWMRSFWDSLTVAPTETAGGGEALPDLHHLRASLRARLESGGLRESPKKPITVPSPIAQPLLRISRLRRWSAAAALGLTLSVGGWLGLRQLTQAPANLTAAAHYSAPYGKIRSLQLADGSRVVLNANSTLRYAAAAEGGPREAWLDGEGYFEVRHQTDDRRFVVHTANGPDVEVLGTRFNVYRRHGRAEVVLISGKVRVSFPDRRHADVTMLPGEQIAVRDTLPEALVHQVVAQPTAFAAWKDGRLVMHEMPIGELITRLRDTYGVDIEVRGAQLKNRKISGTLIVSDLDVLMIALRESFKLTVKQEHGRIIVSDN